MENKKPDHLIKYFKKCDLKYFKKGSIKFGNTSEYRNLENEKYMEGRVDEKDATTEKHGFLSDPKSTSQKYFKEKKSYYENISPNISVSGNYSVEIINAWVFCATAGKYDPSHHNLMMHGDPKTGYLGNKSLTCWCVFDTSRLLKALDHSLRGHEKFNRRNPSSQVLYWREVSYDWSPSRFDDATDEFRSITGNIRQLSDNDVVERLTTKRPIFKTEEEFRIIARMDERKSLYDTDPAILIENENILESIVDIIDDDIT